VPLRMSDPWQEAMEIASQLRCPALVVDTEKAAQSLGQSRKLAEALGAEYVALENLEDSDNLVIALQRLPGAPR
jgi:magnesium chelatase subunit D